MFWGFILTFVGQFLILIVANIVTIIIGLILGLVGIFGIVYGLNLFRRDYRMRVRKETQYLPPPSPSTSATFYCPKCGRPTIYVPQYNKYYCEYDKEYVG
jgi:ribosomal protein L37AE/L43A